MVEFFLKVSNPFWLKLFAFSLSPGAYSVRQI